jgi:hypothetical protein
MITLKGGNTGVGKIAKITIEQDLDTDVQEHHIPPSWQHNYGKVD